MSDSLQTDPTMLPLSRIKCGYNPRRYFDDRKHQQLVTSIRLRGLLQSLLLRPMPGNDECFLLIAGGRRYKAALEVFGANGEVPVVIREMTDQEALEAAIDENDVRDDASETEQADAAVRVLAACLTDRAEAAARLGWSRAKLDRRLALAELSDTVKRALDERRIKVGHAELLAAVPGDKQDKALETILASSLDVGKTRDLLMRVTQDLSRACFDKTECLTCPFNSASQRTLFEIHIDDGHCTNAGCFELKTEAAYTLRVENEERAAQAAKDAAPPAGDEADSRDQDDSDDEPEASHGSVDPTFDAPRPAGQDRTFILPGPSTAKPAGTAISAQRPTVTARSVAGRTTDLREAIWRTALARTLAGHPAFAQIAILVAAMSGTLSQIKSETLRGRAGLLVDAAFPTLDYHAQIAAIRALTENQAATILSAIGAAYARDVASFGHVVDLARAFGVDVRDIWVVDQPYLERYTKDELKFTAHECGLVAHLGEKAFARLLGAKKADLVQGMLKAPGFEWAGRLPSAMTLDGRYGPPPADASGKTDAPIADIAA